METIIRAMQAVQRNLGTLAFYTIIMFAAASADHVVDVSLGHVDNPFRQASDFAIHIGIDVFLIVTSSVAQAVAFSRMGKEIDRPLWKISGDKEALARYFPLWLVLNLVTIIAEDLANFFILESSADAGVLFLFLFGVLNIVSVPVGAAIMFHGRIEYRSLGEYLKPLLRQIIITLPILMLSTAVFFLCFYLTSQEGQPWLGPLVAIVGAYFDCVLFAATWLLCMYDRQNPEELDLDF